MDHLVRTRPSHATPLVFVAAAAPCGSWLSRDLTNNGPVGGVVAPSRMPKQAGDRVNTDRREALPWARLLRSGDLTPVAVPTGADEALRDLTRAREAAIRDLQAATCRLNAFLLRPDRRDTGRATWGPAPRRGLADVVCAPPAPPIVCQASVRAVHEHTARLQRLEQERQEQVNTWRLPPVVEALEGRRGVPGTVAVPLVADLGDLTRVEKPRPGMSALGLSPSASSSGARRRQGLRPTAGNTQARRVLVAGPWASRSPANGSRPWPLRLEQLPKPLQDSSWQAHVRLCPRLRRLLARGQHAHQVVVAMARALAGFLWAMATQGPVTP